MLHKSLKGICLVLLCLIVGSAWIRAQLIPVTSWQDAPNAGPVVFSSTLSDSFTNSYLTAPTNSFVYDFKKFSYSWWVFELQAHVSRTWGFTHWRSGGNFSFTATKEFNANFDNIRLYWSYNGTLSSNLISSSTSYDKDTNIWVNYIVQFDTSQSVASNRVIGLRNGSRISWPTNAIYYPALNTNLFRSVGPVSWNAYDAGSVPGWGLLAQMAVFTNYAVQYSDVASGGHPIDLTGKPGLISWIQPSASGNPTNDAILGNTKWTAVNTVTTTNVAP